MKEQTFQIYQSEDGFAGRICAKPESAINNFFKPWLNVRAS